MADNAYQKKLRDDLEALADDWYLETEITLESVKTQFDGESLYSADIQAIADHDYAQVFRNHDVHWTELPSGAGFVWTP